MVEVSVARLGLDSSTNSFVVILQERDGSRLLPIWIGRPEAEAIAAHLQSIKRERPLTHDLAKSLIIGLGAELRRVSITRVAERTYYAELQLAKGAELIAVGSDRERVSGERPERVYSEIQGPSGESEKQVRQQRGRDQYLWLRSSRKEPPGRCDRSIQTEYGGLSEFGQCSRLAGRRLSSGRAQG